MRSELCNLMIVYCVIICFIIFCIIMYYESIFIKLRCNRFLPIHRRAPVRWTGTTKEGAHGYERERETESAKFASKIKKS